VLLQYAVVIFFPRVLSEDAGVDLMQNSRSALGWGILYGMAAWFTYGLVEFTWTTVLPMLHRSQVLCSWLWPQIAALAGAYLLAGVVTGGIGGAVAAWAAERFGWPSEQAVPGLLEAGATLMLALAFAANLATELGSWPARMALLAPLGLAYGLIWSRTSKPRAERWRFLANPWVAAILLLSLPWYTDGWTKHSRAVNLALPLLIAAIFGVLQSAPGSRFWQMVWPPAGKDAVFRRAAILAGAGLTVGAVTLTGGFTIDKAMRKAHFSVRAGTGPNVVLVTMDTVEASHVSLYGYSRDTTPQLREFARSATLFKRAIAAGDMTLPTHASIFTGIYPREHGGHPESFGPGGLGTNGLPVARKFHTLAECLSARGYATAAVVSNYIYLREEYGLARGFQMFYSPGAATLFVEVRYYLLREGIRKLVSLFFSTREWDREMIQADQIDQDVFTVLGKLKQDRSPFFLFVNYMDAHFPYLPPAPFDTRFPGKDPAFTDRRYDAMKQDVVRRQVREVTERERQHLESQHDGGIAYLDTQIGKLIARLKQMGLYDNTMIVITADHGEEFGRHQLLGHGKSVYQAEVHVPLLVKYPGQTQGSVTNELANQVDLMPTILAALDCPVPPDVRGRDLRHPDTAPREVFSMSYYSTYRIPRFDRVETAIFSGPMKLITSTRGKRELYDLSQDPEERHNLYRPEDSQAQELQARVAAWMQATPQFSAADAKLDPQMLRRLRSLGYVQ
jgi:arylsulfatase A-like enzyme